MTVRKEIRWFAEKMEDKLVINDHKGGWLNQDGEFFLEKMRKEYHELTEALLKGDATAAIYECADLANFAMMLADNLWRYGVISDGTLTNLAMERLVTKPIIHDAHDVPTTSKPRNEYYCERHQYQMDPNDPLCPGCEWESHGLE